MSNITEIDTTVIEGQDEEEDFLNPSYSRPRRISLELQETKRLLIEKERDALLAAEIGQALLQENNKLREEIAILNDTISQLESAVLQQQEQQLNKHKGIRVAQFSTSDDRDEVERLAEDNESLQLELLRMKQQATELRGLYENSERSRYDVLDEVETMKKVVENIRHEMMKDQETIKVMKEIVETQKQTLTEAAKLEEENKKVIAKLKQEQFKLTQKVETAEDSIENLQSLKDENQKLKRELSQKKKIEQEYELVCNENQEIRELLKDKERMAETVQFLVEENQRYRREHEEMLILLEEAKKSAADLKESLEESMLQHQFGSPMKSGSILEDSFSSEWGDVSMEMATSPGSVSTIPQNSENELWNYFEKHADEIKEIIESKNKKEGHTRLVRSQTSLTPPRSPPRTRARADSSGTAIPRRGSLPPAVAFGVDEVSIQSNMANFRKRSHTFSKKEPTSKDLSNLLEEKQYLVKLLDNKLKSAETRLTDMQSSLVESQRKDQLLQDLNKRLVEAEEKLRGKESEISRLQQELIKTKNTGSSAKITIKEGWLHTRGHLLPTWSRQWFILTNYDGVLYQAKSPNDKVTGLLNLRGAYVCADSARKMGRNYCIILMSETDKRTYYLGTETEEEMNDWINALQERIEALSFV